MVTDTSNFGGNKRQSEEEDKNKSSPMMFISKKQRVRKIPDISFGFVCVFVVEFI
eukprot:TRINITY_DN312_c0_g1_i3.p2 TRINITY_DN312_c0_g1~~TRINITY_DN312_c0_g1_i3.p2  ORF type:complete len:55 (-),score=9.11 TRINITY_DN312_c0_g1_i3:65-229(-)